MSINAVSVNECTVDALCGSRRAAIINALVGLLPQGETGKGRTAGYTPVVRDIRWREQREDEYVESEQPFVAVTVTFNGIKNTHTLERLSIDDLPLVTVRGLKSMHLAQEHEETLVSVSNIRVQETAQDVVVNISNIKTRIV